MRLDTDGYYMIMSPNFPVKVEGNMGNWLGEGF